MVTKGDEMMETEPFKTIWSEIEEKEKKIEKLELQINRMSDLYNLGNKMDIIIEHLRIKNKFDKK